MRGPVIVLVILLLWILLLTNCPVAAEAHLVKIAEGQLGQNDLERDECYAAIGQNGMIALRPGAEGCAYLREFAGKRVEVLIREVE